MNGEGQQDTTEPTTTACRWLSKDFEALIKHSQTQTDCTPHFDLVIVGSGYGGAIAAAELAGSRQNNKPLRICVLERGKEYLPGMFPSRMADLPGHVRFSTANQAQPNGIREGLFDLRMGNTLNTLVGNGLGGGSLINAGVMIEPKPTVFDERWPTPLQSKNSSELLDTFFPDAKRLLDAADQQGDITISRHAKHQQSPLAKHQQLKQMANNKKGQPETFYDAAITVAMEDGPNSAGVRLNACKMCGDCATGCNYNAKQSLDTNLLVKARQLGVEIYTGASVLSLSATDNKDGSNASGWILSTVHTDARKRQIQQHPFSIRADKVILAAGSLGSTEILLRSQKNGLKISSKIGQGFSSNGDMLANVYQQKNTVNAVALETTPPEQRHIGPTITGVLDLRDQQTPLLIEEMAVPGPLRRLYEELVTTVSSLAELQTKHKDRHFNGQPEQDPWSVSSDAIKRTGIYAIMGDDGSQGSLELTDQEDAELPEGEGALRVHWPELPEHPLFDAQMDTLNERLHASGVGGQAQANPSWKPLPDAMQALAGGGRGPLLTVHPLGGCAMGDDASQGVVDHCGRVFDTRDASMDQVYDNLVVLDGAMIPSALGANPALTIAAVSLRAARLLRRSWQWETSALPTQPQIRPIFKQPVTLTHPTPTEIEITERISGRAKLTDKDQHPIDCVIDITLRFQPKPVLDLVHHTKRTLVVNTEQAPDEPFSELRVFHYHTWQKLIQAGASDKDFTHRAILVAPVTGTLEIMGREASTYWPRVMRTIFKAWLPNRGLRDFYQSVVESCANSKRPTLTPMDKLLNRCIFNAVRNRRHSKTPLWRKLQAKVNESMALASRGGEVRLFDYKLQMHKPADGWPTELGGLSDVYTLLPVAGKKRITYGRASNPLRQFEDMHLETFPGLQPNAQQHNGKRPYLRFDSRFVTHYNKPLLRIVKQQDQVTALADMAAFGAYFFRGIIQQHLWSFRKPDSTTLTSNRRLPGVIAGIHPPEITELAVGEYDLGLAVPIPVCIRLTRYPQPDKTSDLPPIVMIHGYSASGNTYTHPSLKPSMAEYCWHRGRDVWVVDLRTSCGMATAMLPWSFEDVAYADIPVAIDHICRTTQQPCVDIVAHCMGSAMFSMAILAPPKHGDRYYQERLKLPQRINRVALSQVGPRVVFTPENIFRAYGLSYAQQLIPQLFYSFQRSEAPSGAEQLLDRLLSALPYPDGEFEQENPIWPWATTPYVGTRHRMDALYGRTFSLRNVSKATLQSIDDMFGPLSMATLSQTIRFAMHERITNKNGENEFVTRERLQQRWHFPTLSVHGDENGLADIATLGRMKVTMQDAGRDYRTHVLKGFGHQDSLIGIGAEANYATILAFLDETEKTAETTLSSSIFQLMLPFSGPLIRPINDQQLQLGLGFSTQMNRPEFVLFIPVTQKGDRIQCFGCNTDTPLTAQWLKQHLYVKFAHPNKDNWLKTQLTLTPAMQQADGILTIVVDDLEVGLSHLLQLESLSDNLLDLIDQPDMDPAHQELAQYLNEKLLGNALISPLNRFLDQPADTLKAGIIELPTATPNDQLQLVLAACQYPAGMLDRKPAYASYARLADHLEHTKRRSQAKLTPSLAILTGDQVYTDASAGLLDPTDRFNRFVDAYHRWLYQPEVKSVLRRLPVLTMLDDHEILNDWNQALEDTSQGHYLKQGKAGYLHFQRPDMPTLTQDQALQQPLWYRSRQSGFDIFVMDVRTEREGRATLNKNGKLENPDAKLVSHEQMQALQGWLLNTKTTDHRPRFVVSASMLLPRRLKSTLNDGSTLHADAWDGYPRSLNQLLNIIATGDHRNLIFLSGDEHLSSVVDIKLHQGAQEKPIQVYSIHSSALYAPLTFVNSTPEIMAANETFDVPRETAGSEADLRCEVHSRFYPGNGFALISVYPTTEGWGLECEFDREQGTSEPERLLHATAASPNRPATAEAPNHTSKLDPMHGEHVAESSDTVMVSEEPQDML